MHNSVRHRVSRALGVLVLAGAAISLMPASTFAETLISQTGTIGDAFFRDTLNHPGASCSYQGTAGTLYFSGLTVKGPKLMWPDQIVNVTEHGWVSYRIQIQQFDGANWNVVKHSKSTKLKVYDTVTTKFPAKSLSWSGPNTGNFRAGVTLKWIKTNGTTWGRSTYYINYHRAGFDNSVGSDCVGSTPTHL